MDYTQYTNKVNDKVKKLFDAETPDVKSKIKFGFNSYGYSDYRVPQGLTTCHGILFFALQYKI